MYPMNGASSANRLPRSDVRPAVSSASSPTLTKAIGGALIQAACVVLVAKAVDLAIEAFINRRRERQHQAPQRGRREEPVGV